jgi:trk system potassium uptake protein
LAEPETVAVIGLAAFGRSIAEMLIELGHEVLGIDHNEARTQELSTLLTHVVSADATEPGILESLGVHKMDHVVVAIGDHIEESVLCTAALVDLGARDIWAQAHSVSHGRILERIGANRVVNPERDSGRRLGRLVSGRLLDYIEIDEGFALLEITVPPALVGTTVREAQLRSRYGLIAVSVRQPGGMFGDVTPDVVLTEGATILVAGQRTLIDTFAGPA